MARTGRNQVVAREAIVINVGARPIEYGQITVADRRSGERKVIDNQNTIVDPGEEGMPYAFKAGERVSKGHPAVKANPGAFMSVNEADDEDDGA